MREFRAHPDVERADAFLFDVRLPTRGRGRACKRARESAERDHILRAGGGELERVRGGAGAGDGADEFA